MTFTVESQPKLSQTVVRTFKRQCIDLVQRGACFADIRTEIILPFLEYFLEEKNWSLDADAVVIVQAMCKQGALPCAILNKYQNVITGIKMPELGRKETFEPNEENIKAFLRESLDNFLAQPEDLFEPKQFLETDDMSVLRTCVSFLRDLLDQIKNISHQVDYETLMPQLSSEPLLFAHLDTQSLRSSTISQRPIDMAKGPEGKLHQAQQEFLTSEAQYVADMGMLQGYIKEIRLRRLIDPNRLAQAFGSLDAIVEVQNRFLLDLEGHYSSNLDVHPEVVFQQYTEKFLDAYKEFLENYPLAENLLLTHANALLVLEHRFMHPQTAAQSYLVKPIQRICKYQILFEAIIKNTPKDHRLSLIEGCRAAKTLATRLNEIKVAAENRVEDARFRMDSDFINKDKLGELLMFGPVILAEEEDRRDYICYLYEHYLIFAKERQRKALGQLNGPIMTTLRTSLSNLLVKRTVVVSSIQSIDDTSRVEPNSVKITFIEDKSTTFFLLLLPFPDMFRRWYRTLVNCHDIQTVGRVRYSAGHRSLFVPDISEMMKSFRTSEHERSRIPEVEYTWPERVQRCFVVNAFDETLILAMSESTPSLDAIRAAIQARFLRTVIGSLYWREDAGELVKVDRDEAMQEIYKVADGLIHLVVK